MNFMNIPALKAFESSTLVYSQLQLLFNLFQDPYALFVRAFIMDVFDDDVEQTLSCLLEKKNIRPLGCKATNAAGSLGNVGHAVYSSFVIHERHQCKKKKKETRSASSSELISITIT